jgi:hypothetical protein
VNYARAEFQLSQTQTDGSPLRAHLRQLEKTTGQRHPLLRPKKFPEPLAYVMRWFTQLSELRHQHRPGQPLTLQEIVTWQSVTRIVMTQYERECIFALDQVWLDVVHGED